MKIRPLKWTDSYTLLPDHDYVAIHYYHRDPSI